MSYGMHHHWSGGMSLPADADAATYLHIAKTAIMHRNATLADEALGRAETRLLDRAVPQGQVGPDQSPVVQSIENARHALQGHDFKQAGMATSQAESSVGGM
jgi:hypothetical protein